MAEKQYQGYADLPRERLGLRANCWWSTDPRSLLFSMARYEFVAKMLAGKKRVLEVGCGDAFCTRLVQQEVGFITAIDFDDKFIEDVIQRCVVERNSDRWPLDMFTHDIIRGPVYLYEEGILFDAAYALDVIEHIPPPDEHTFMKNVANSLRPEGVLILGTPSKESQAFASEGSKAGHVNLFDAPRLKALMGEYFQNIFMFGMNDTALHTGFDQMRHYLFAIGAGKKG